MHSSKSSSAERIAANLARVRQQIAAAAQRSGRTADAVRLVAVTKYVGADEARALVAAGCHDLGESRPQELWRKADQLHSEPIDWHLVGHLQRNKIARTLPLVTLIHSVDSLRLLTSLDEAARRLGRSCRVLLEVNTSGESAKHGLAPDLLHGLIEQLPTFAHVRVEGLMTMAQLEGDPDVARRNFAALRELGDRLAANCPDNASLGELSMGMSGDFEIAIEEGATIVRIGTSLFEGVAL